MLRTNAILAVSHGPTISPKKPLTGVPKKRCARLRILGPWPIYLPSHPNKAHTHSHHVNNCMHLLVHIHHDHDPQCNKQQLPENVLKKQDCFLQMMNSERRRKLKRVHTVTLSTSNWLPTMVRLSRARSSETPNKPCGCCIHPCCIQAP